MDAQDRERLVGRSVHVDFRKWPDRTHYQYSMEVLGQDRHGLWLWAPRGTVGYRGSDGPFNFQKTWVKLIADGWWAANWIENPVRGVPAEVYVDIIKPAVWIQERVVMVDLDLDVRDLGSGNVTIVDEDEFLQNQVAFAYTAELIEGARLAADQVYQAIVRREEPFGQVGPQWLAAALAKPRVSP